ncbi:iron ABC transporter permease [uncultured Psychrosphaera sp.]|uniref:FecCD family ABC transporter permease n=1 Tax=uncultured Psychrosphaera sp. TaxID=1403522 RepID=UPI0026084FB5|nr:iron ABC transporter permease [uncultured Psychrosphaera sp.]
MKPSLLLSLVLSVLVVSFISALTIGAADLTFNQVLLSLFGNVDEAGTVAHSIIWQLRMPRSILAFVAGCGLAMAGLILQTITRNPLADPYLFGISSGASFGVVIVMTLTGVGFGFYLSFAAFLGSLLAISLLLLIAGFNRHQQVESMLLAGVALSFLFSSFTSLMLYWSDPQAVSAILFWTLGSFSRAQWDLLWFPCLVVISCLGLMLAKQRQLNAVLLGDEGAVTLGVNVNRLRITMLLLSSILTASIVALCGGIGFVGLMIPHIVRFFIGQGGRLSLIITALVGGVFMLWVDIASRVILDNQELPIGIITAAVGSLFFLTLLYVRKRKSVI